MTEVKIVGCDDSTYFDLETSQEEREFLGKLAELSQKVATYGCQPRIFVKEKE